MYRNTPWNHPTEDLLLDNLKYLPTTNSLDQSLPTPTTFIDVPIHPNASSPSKLPEASTPPPSVDQCLPMASIFPPCSPGLPSGPSTMSPSIIASSPLMPPPWAPYLEVSPPSLTELSFNQLMTFQKTSKMANFGWLHSVLNVSLYHTSSV